LLSIVQLAYNYRCCDVDIGTVSVCLFEYARLENKMRVAAYLVVVVKEPLVTRDEAAADKRLEQPYRIH